MVDDLGQVTDWLILPWKPGPVFPSEASHSQQIGREPDRQVLPGGYPHFRSGCLGATGGPGQIWALLGNHSSCGQGPRGKEGTKPHPFA